MYYQEFEFVAWILSILCGMLAFAAAVLCYAVFTDERYPYDKSVYAISAIVGIVATIIFYSIFHLN